MRGSGTQYLDKHIPMGEFIMAIAHQLPTNLSIPLVTANNINTQEELMTLIKQLASVNYIEEPSSRSAVNRFNSDNSTGRRNSSNNEFQRREKDSRELPNYQKYRRQYFNNKNRSENGNHKGNNNNL